MTALNGGFTCVLHKEILRFFLHYINTIWIILGSTFKTEEYVTADEVTETKVEPTCG